MESQTAVRPHANPLTYAPRLVKAFPPVEVGGRTLKAYGVFAEPERPATLPSPEWLREQCAPALREPARPEDHPVGFMVLHYAADGTYLLVSQWFGANMLRVRVRGAGADAGHEPDLAPLDQHEVFACVWELEVIKFERDAWVNTVLARGSLDRDSLDAYLAATFTGWV